MNHISEGDLRAYLDNELPATQVAAVEAHLAGCAACAQERDTQAARAARLTALWGANEIAAPAQSAVRLRARPAPVQPVLKETYLMKRRIPFRYAALATAAILMVALLFPPVQSWAGQFLGLFRVDRVTVLPVDFDTLASGFDNESALMSDMLSENVETEEIGEERSVASWEEAAAAAGFAVLAPAALEAPVELNVSSGANLKITLDAEQLRAVVSALGRDDVNIPDSLTGSVINVNVPQGVQAFWGECVPDDLLEEGPRPVCTTLIQIPSPTVSTPPDLDMVAMGELYLQLLGLEREEAAQLSTTLDWSSTLVVPIPRDQASYREVTVDGVEGTLIEGRGQHSPHMLIWVREGVLYAVGGTGNADSMLEIANSLR